MKEPPALGELSGNDVASAGDPAAWASRAVQLYERRTAETVEQAAELWTRAADAAPQEIDSIVGAVRARIWLADHAADDSARKDQATKAVQTAQWCDPRDPGSPVCAYWLGAALGVQARERRSTALDALEHIVGLFEQAVEGAPELDHAGPERALALVYLRAPGWPSGVGDPDLGLEYAEKAVDREPGFPPNQLALGEAFEAVEMEQAAIEAYRVAVQQAVALATTGHPEAAGWSESGREALARLGATPQAER